MAKKKNPGSRQGSSGQSGNSSYNRGRKPQSGAAGPGANKPEPYPYTGPGSAPGAPGGPPPMPGATYDSSYTSGLGALSHESAFGLLDVEQSRDRMGFDSGYGADGGIDPRNPYSQAMALQKAWKESRSGTSVSMAARGQLYSGARERQLADVDYRRNESDAGIKEGARRGYEDLKTREQSIRARYDPATGTGYGQSQLHGEQAQRWQDQQNEWYRLYG